MFCKIIRYIDENFGNISLPSRFEHRTNWALPTDYLTGIGHHKDTKYLYTVIYATHIFNIILSTLLKILTS